MTQAGETDGYKASDHLKAIIYHSTPDIVNTCIVNTGGIHGSILEKYRQEKAESVESDHRTIQKMGYRVIGANIINAKDYVRHDSYKLSRIIMNLIGEYTRRRTI